MQGRDNRLTILQGEANVALLALLRTWFCGVGRARRTEWSTGKQDDFLCCQVY